MPQSPQTAIMVIGGAEDKVHGKEILHTFFSRSGGSNAQIAVIPCASREPAIIGERYRSIFLEMGAKAVTILDIRDRDDCANPLWQAYMDDCTGVFMTGGDQLRLCALIAETSLVEKMRKRAQAGDIALGGTSAGAAVMGHHMIAGGGSGECPNRSLADMAIGLGIIPGIIVDQHFHNRNRMARLMSAIAAQPEKLGIGIDEDTCALFEANGLIRVLGKATITIIDPTALSYTNQYYADASSPLSIHDLRIHILSHGDSYDMINHTTIPPERIQL